MHLPERLYGCKLQQFYIDNIILVYMAQLSQVTSVLLWETDTEVKTGYVKTGYTDDLFMSILYFTSVSLFTISLHNQAGLQSACLGQVVQAGFLKDRTFTVFCIYFF